MEEKKSIKVSLSTIFLIVAIIIIVIMGYFIYDISNKRTIAEKEMQNLNNKIEDLQEIISNMSNKLNNSTIDEDNESTSKQTSNLTEEQKNTLFDKIQNISMRKGIILNAMIGDKDFSTKKFTDEDILNLLPVIDKNNEFFTLDENSSEGFFVKGKISDVQKLSQKYFERTINVNELSNKIENDIIWIEADSGFGIETYQLESVSTNEDNTYTVKFKYVEEDTSYTLTVKYENDNIIFVSFEKLG